ncbi:hypothetical protein [Granulicella sp. dw_53]|uniref:hypothetical protein n=1 Tax=Granulicella sp. dw_53 TaxID=2719792 RepID=UPI001BD2D437|nr:hypothetical protein [Granulicella sp. dw_53]
MPSQQQRLAYPCILLLTMMGIGSARHARAQTSLHPEAQATLYTVEQPLTTADTPYTEQSSTPKPPEPRPPASAALQESAEAVDSPGLPFLHGFNAGITLVGIHDSVVGWSTLATPSIGYSFNDIFSIDATLPIYMYRLAENLSTRTRRSQLLVNQRGELGDVVLGFHAQFIPRHLLYQANVAVTAPTGDEAYGLTTGRCTFDLTNHFERSFGRLTPNIELGVGDSSYLVNRLVNKNYTSLGPISHYQLGLGIELLRNIFFETDAYENLPIGDQKIYGPSRNGRATIVTGRSVTEDNGLTNSLEVPIDRHTSLSTYYSRSLRLHIDSVAFGVTYVLRAPAPPVEEPLDDLFR